MASPCQAALGGRLGLGRGAVHTANDTSVSYDTRLHTVSVASIVLNDVSAGIVPGFEGEEVLLGMTFLKHIEFTQRGDSLMSRQER